MRNNNKYVKDLTAKCRYKALMVPAYFSLSFEWKHGKSWDTEVNLSLSSSAESNISGWIFYCFLKSSWLFLQTGTFKGFAGFSLTSKNSTAPNFSRPPLTTFLTRSSPPDSKKAESVTSSGFTAPTTPGSRSLFFSGLAKKAEASKTILASLPGSQGLLASKSPGLEAASSLTQRSPPAAGDTQHEVCMDCFMVRVLVVNEDALFACFATHFWQIWYWKVDFTMQYCVEMRNWIFFPVVL